MLCLCNIGPSVRCEGYISPSLNANNIWNSFLNICDARDTANFSEKSDNIISLDSYILNSLNNLNLIWIYISHCMTSLLKLEITV